MVEPVRAHHLVFESLVHQFYDLLLFGAFNLFQLINDKVVVFVPPKLKALMVE